MKYYLLSDFIIALIVLAIGNLYSRKVLTTERQKDIYGLILAYLGMIAGTIILILR